FVPIHVAQGEREMAADNTTLARFELAGIPPAPRGVPQIQVVFDIDANGIVAVSAKDLGTGKQQVVRVTAASGLSQKDIERIINEAESQREGDSRRKELAEAKVAAESLLYTTKRAIEEYGDVLAAGELEVIKGDALAMEQALVGEDVELIRRLRSELESSAFRIAEAMYANLPVDGRDPEADTDPADEH
ncbi:MAG TPA: Hsp70 family protein, partial [Polyangia bacterium]|nr:Hsp70 family protein [Polyangia bacterium]